MAQKGDKSSTAKSEKQKSKSAPEKAESKPTDAKAAPTEHESPPVGADEARHAANQRRVQQADFIKTSVFPAMMATALGLDKHVETAAYGVYLEGLFADAGSPKDPLEKMMIEQMAMAHFRVAYLQAKAAEASGLEATKILNSCAARMLGEMRRTYLALKASRSSVPEGKSKGSLRLFKAAA